MCCTSDSIVFGCHSRLCNYNVLHATGETNHHFRSCGIDNETPISHFFSHIHCGCNSGIHSLQDQLLTINNPN